jgi:hypothetical protein
MQVILTVLGSFTLSLAVSTTTVRLMTFMLGVLEPDSNPANAGYFDFFSKHLILLAPSMLK